MTSSCQKVRLFLPLAADPLELMVLPAWLEEHLAACKDCWQEFQRLEEFCHIIVVAEIPPLIAKKILIDASPEFLKKVQNLRTIQPEQITCEQAKLHYRGVATCNRTIPPEIYRHTRHCASCKEHIQQLRFKLDVDIPHAATKKFERLRLQPDGLRRCDRSPQDTDVG